MTASLKNSYASYMMPNIAHPYSVSVIMAAALVAVVAFTASRILATVPVGALSVVGSEMVHTVTKENYFGVVSWVSRNSIEIIDSHGVTRVIAIDDNTSILKEAVSSEPQKYSDIRIFDHVRVVALKDGTDVRAQNIEVQ
jgi:hypothetical protein